MNGVEKMPIEPKENKQVKVCRYCNKEVVNLGLHIANLHPSVFEQIDETTPQKQTNTPLNATDNAILDIDAIVSKKVNTMMNIQIMKMLANGADLKDIQSFTKPATNQLDELKKYHDIVYGTETKGSLNVNVGSEETGGGQWLELANNALPIIAQIMNNRGGKQNDELGTNKTGYIPTDRDIHEETKLDRGESESISTESDATIQPIRTDKDEPSIINTGNK